MTPLAQRFAYGTPLLAAVVALLAWDRASGRSTGVTLLAALFSLVAILEYVRMFRLGGLLGGAAVAGVALLIGAHALGGAGVPPPVALALLALAPAIFILLLFLRPPSGDALRRAATALFGALWIGLPMVAILELSSEPGWGVGWLLFLVLVVKGNDIGAFLVGRTWGRTPLTAISPKKTREGALGGLAYGIAAAVALVALDGEDPLGYPGGAALALAIGVAGQVGDLVESYLKRAAGVKDSGALIPAFGGGLDLLDSILLAGPALLAAQAFWT